MLFEVVSTRSWSVLGTFEDEEVAREAVRASVAQRGTTMHDLVVYVSDDDGQPSYELEDNELAGWAGIAAAGAAAHLV
jgi:hypothetical protein